MQHSERAGLLFALAGFCTLSIGDVVVKGMAGMWPPTAIAMLRYVLAAVALSGMLVAREGWAPLLSMPKPHVQWLRGLGVTVASIAFFAGSWLMPLSEAIAITFTQPMFTAFLAVLFLGERLRPRTIIATLVAFAGVLIVLRPNFAVIGLGALLPLLAALGMAVLMTANRAAARSGGALAMQVYIALTASVLLIAATIIGHFSGIEGLQMHWPSWGVVARCALIACTASVAHWLIYMGTMNAGAATVAPMTYGQLLTATGLAWIVYNEVPDGMAMLGASLIVAAGLWLWYMGRQRRPAEPAR